MAATLKHPESSHSQEDALEFQVASRRGGRTAQEDRAEIFHDKERSIFLAVVADGVGGRPGGGQTAEEVIAAANEVWPIRDQQEGSELLRMLQEKSHQRIRRLASGGLPGSRSTLAALWISGHRACWASCGDSRIYRFSNGNFVERTRDHSVVQILLDMGDLRESELPGHPDRGRLTSVLGGEDEPRIEIGGSEVGSGDVFVLCTDGFWGQLAKGELEQLARSRDTGSLLTSMAEEMERRGGPDGDNVTAAVVRFLIQQTSEVTLKSRGRTRLWIGLSLIGLGAVLAALLVQLF